MPFDILIGACFQLPPRYKQSVLERPLFPVESNVEDEIVEVPSTHPPGVAAGTLGWISTLPVRASPAKLSFGSFEPECRATSTSFAPSQ